jgi:hypothetical protein
LPTPVRLAFAILTVGTLVLLWASPQLPMTDLPQHEAQVATWIRLGDPDFVYADLYRINPFTPYLFCYLLGRGFALFLPVEAAMRCVVTLALVGLPWSLRLLLRRAGGDPAWALAAFPLAFSFAFYWGFLNFLLALPVALLYLTALREFAKRPSRRNGALLAVFAAGMFFCHALIWGVCLLATLGLAWQSAKDWGGRLRLAVPGLVSVPLAAAWLGSVLLVSERREAQAAPDFAISLERFTGLPEALLGADAVASGVGFVILAAIAFGAGGVTRDLERWVPFGVAGGLYMLAPAEFMGIHFLYHRFLAPALLLSLLVLEPHPEPKRRHTAAALLAAAALCWLVTLGARFTAFADEVADFEAVAAEVAPPCRIYTMIFSKAQPPLTGEPHRHLPVRLQARHPAVVEWSFSHYYPLLVGYKPSVRSPLNPNPLWEAELGDYDYVVVRFEDDLTDLPHFLPAPRWTRTALKGTWSLYRRSR